MQNSNQRAGRIGGLRLHATRDSNAIAARARAGLERKFRNEVVELAEATGEGALSDVEVARRTAAHRRIYFLRLAAKARSVRERRAVLRSLKRAA